MCKKESYNSESNASHVAYIMNKKYLKTKGWFTYYLCSICNKWHVGRENKKRFKKLQKMNWGLK